MLYPVLQGERNYSLKLRESPVYFPLHGNVKRILIPPLPKPADRVFRKTAHPAGYLDKTEIETGDEAVENPSLSVATAVIVYDPAATAVHFVV
jgi:hypothetical protein